MEIRIDSNADHREYIIIHTREGYLTHGTIASANDSGEVPEFAFTKYIAEAAVFNNLHDVMDLCDKHMASAWMRDDEHSPFRPFYDPSNQFSRDAANELRRKMYAKLE